MPAAVPLPIRQAMWRRWESGATASELSQVFDLNPRTVRKLLQRWRQNGPESLVPSYRRAPRPLPPPAHPAFEPAVTLRRQHPGWGAGLIRVYLKDQGIQPVPCERTLQRWFQRVGLGPAPAGLKPASSRRRATHSHDIWQMDAAEEIGLAEGQRVCWLRIVDEFSGAVLQTAIFPPRTLELRSRDGDPGDIAAVLWPLGNAQGDSRG